MTLSVYAVCDSKAASYNTPFFVVNEAYARRAFVDLCRDQRSIVAQHPEDFSLFFLGFFDQEKGSFFSNPGEKLPVAIMSGIEARVAAHKADQLQSELLAVADDSSKS